MVQRPTIEQLFELERLTSQQRKAVFENPYSFLLFFSYYYSPFIKSPFADFHLDFAEDLGDLVTGKIHELAWVTGRDTAKTSFAKAFLVQCIGGKKFRYPNVDSFERSNSERFLFEVVNNLQTNARFRFDYGELFNAPTQKGEKTQKRVSDFLTNNGIRVEAHTTQESIRGRVHNEDRPDLIIIDDFETLNTVRSEAATKEIAEHISEMKGGIDQKNCRILYLCNKISDEGNVAKLEERAKDDPYFRVRHIFLLTPEGTPSWPERYVLTDDELRLHPQKTSIETIRRSMRSPDTGDNDFLREMMGQVFDPFGNGPDKQGYLPLFPDFDPPTSQFIQNPPHAIGVDPAGDGDDECAIVVRSQFQMKIFAREKKSTGKSIAALVIQAMRDYDVPPKRVVVDAFGVGFKVVQELSLLGHEVKAVNVGEKTEELCQNEYLNDRAYAYFKLKEWFVSGGATDGDPLWQREAKAIRFISMENRRKIMSKREIIKRGMKSPNVMDAAALSCLIDLSNHREQSAVAQNRPTTARYGQRARAKS